MSSPLTSRAITLPRLAIVSVFLVSLFVLRGFWLPASTSPSVPLSELKDEWLPPSKTESSYVPTSSGFTDTSSMPTPSARPACANLPGADDVFVVLKTGAAEVYKKLPQHFLTLFPCVPNYIIFSDLEQDFAGYHIHDALDGVSEDAKKDHSEFELYRALQELKQPGRSLKDLKIEIQGWNLDKWKFLPMVHKAYKARPTAKWYMLIEADTSLHWSNLLLWLSKLDWKEPIYAGAQNLLSDMNFAHGGSGILISNPAMKKLDVLRTTVFTKKWDRDTAQSCCGDGVLAQAFLDAGIPLTPAFPLIQGETPSTLDWSPRHWCTPAITWHHMSPAEIDSVWHFQEDWVKEKGANTPVLFRDYFNHFVQPHLSADRANWDNLSDDWSFKKPSSGASAEDFKKWDELSETERNSAGSFEACRAACEDKKDCVQYRHANEECKLNKLIRLGSSTGERGTAWKSGWMLERIEGYKRAQEPCDPKWNFNQR